MNIKVFAKIKAQNKKFGINTVLYNGNENELGYAENNTIFLNLNNEQDFTLTNQHELLHFFENTETFKQISQEILSAFSVEELEKIKIYYQVKYFGVYTQQQIKDGILLKEIVIDAIIGNGNFPDKIIRLAYDKKEKLFSETINKLKEKKYLNINLSNKIEQQFPQLSLWEKMFVLNNYKSLNFNKEIKYQLVRQDIQTKLEKIYKFAENIENFRITYIDNPYLERDFISEIDTLKIKGQIYTAEKLERNKFAIMQDKANKFTETLHAEFKHAVDYIKSTNYEPAFKYLMLNETLQKIYKKEKYINEEKTIITNRELNKSIQGHMNLSEEVLSTIYNNLKDYSNFANLYFAGVAVFNKITTEKSKINITNVSTFNKGKWIKFEGKGSNAKNYINNAQKLSALVQGTPWCTKTLASAQLEQGDFYVFVDNEEKPHIAVKLTGNSIDEVRGIKNGNSQELEDNYRNVAIEFLNNNKNIKFGKEWLEKEEWNDRLIGYIKKIKNKTITQEEIPNLLNDYFFKDYKSHEKINSNILALKKLLPLIKDKIAIHFNCKTNQIIFGNVNHINLPLINLGNLQSICGNANFYGSQISDLGTLEFIGGFANFNNSKINSLNNLKFIDGNANFGNSQLTSLGNLQYIGDYANFENSQLIDLGKLRAINGDAYFSDSILTSLGKLQSIGGDVGFSNSKITDLGNLQCIGGDAMFSFSQITNLNNLQSIGGWVNFTASKITSLGKLQSIGGNAYFTNSKITDLANLQHIGGLAIFEHSQITSLGKLQRIGGDANFINSQINDLGCLELIGGNAIFTQSQIINLGNLRLIGGQANFKNSQVINLGNLQIIGNNVNFSNSKIKDFGKLKIIKGIVEFGDNKELQLKFEKQFYIDKKTGNYMRKSIFMKKNIEEDLNKKTT